jgi:hypothetical protein
VMLLARNDQRRDFLRFIFSERAVTKIARA